MRSGEVIRKAGITRDALRHYVEIGLLDPSVDPSNGYKEYSEDDVELIRFVKQAQEIGFKLSSIKKLSEQMASSVCKHQSLLPYLKKQLKVIEKKISSLEEIRDHISFLITDFETKNCEEVPEDLEL